jgi:hypothetical protein
MADTKQFQVSRMIHAPAEHIFALLADPARHSEIDGSATLQGSESSPITAAEQRFVVNMFRDDLGRYRTVNTVFVFEPPTRIGWAPRLDTSFPCALVDRLAGIRTGGHTFTYQLHESQDGTEVTETYDWSKVPDPKFAAFCPIMTPDDLARTLANVARVAEPSNTTNPLRGG